MITLYSGTPGSGKSLHLARVIYNTLRYHPSKLILSNIDINLSVRGIRFPKNFVYIDNQSLSPEVLVPYLTKWVSDHKKKEGMALLIIDEAQLLFNARSWQSNDHKGWISFFTQHRKYCCDVIMVAQFDRMIDRQIRSLFEYECKHRKVSRFGFRGLLLSLLFGSFVCVESWYGIQAKVSHYFFRYNKRLGLLYDTFAVWKKASA